MFEWSLICRYLIPRRRHLSVSAISAISILVIALVIWLIVVFFSVTRGLERRWTEKLVALTAPVKVTPTDRYYHSYYYLVDRISDRSSYRSKAVGEKREVAESDPYDPEIDQEIPENWLRADRDLSGSLKDPVKGIVEVYEELRGSHKALALSDFELTGAALELSSFSSERNGQNPLLLSFDRENPYFERSLLFPSVEELNGLLRGCGSLPEGLRRDLLGDVCKAFRISELKTPEGGWSLPQLLMPSEATLQGVALFRAGELQRFVIPRRLHDLEELVSLLAHEGFEARRASYRSSGGERSLVWEGGKTPLHFFHQVVVEGGIPLRAKLEEESLGRARLPSEVRFKVEMELQGVAFAGTIPLGSLQISAANFDSSIPSPLWIQRGAEVALHRNEKLGEPIVLPKLFREQGCRWGERGQLRYWAPTASGIEQLSLPVVVAGFYDPGILPMGGRFLLADKEVVRSIRISQDQEESIGTNGFHIHLASLEEAESAKKALEEGLDRRGLASYWKVESYADYPFSRDLIRQLKSDKNLFTLLASLIILVACSNIVSLLIILVQNKRIEIGILRAMGATSTSILLIFGGCGIAIGLLGSLIGIACGAFTLRHLDRVIGILSYLQGYDLLNPNFYGETLPTDLSSETLFFVLAATAFFSMCAGLFPALKACRMRPTHLLKAQ